MLFGFWACHSASLCVSSGTGTALLRLYHKLFPHARDREVVLGAVLWTSHTGPSHDCVSLFEIFFLYFGRINEHNKTLNRNWFELKRATQKSSLPSKFFFRRKLISIISTRSISNRKLARAKAPRKQLEMPRCPETSVFGFRLLPLSIH